MMATGTAQVHSAGQFWIQDLGQPLDDPALWDFSNGLAIPGEHGVVVLCNDGPYGPVTVTVETLEHAPAGQEAVDLAGGQQWDDIVDVSFESVVGPFLVIDMNAGQEYDLPRLDAVGPGWYRLRVHVRNRDVTRVDADGMTYPTDVFRLVSWPEPAHPPLCVRLTDARGLGTRGSVPVHLDAYHAGQSGPAAAARHVDVTGPVAPSVDEAVRYPVPRDDVPMAMPVVYRPCGPGEGLNLGPDRTVHLRLEAGGGDEPGSADNHVR